jgi:trk system potassium uptake protein TrkH
LYRKKINSIRDSLSPIHKVLLSFVFLILAGALVLKLPFATRNGISFVDALFTSTSAVCVTGLAVMDIAAEFTLFGRMAIMTLIQFGGLGIMTFSIGLLTMFADSLSIRWRFTFQDMYSDIRHIPIRSLLKRIVYYTFTIEGTIAVILSRSFIRRYLSGNRLSIGVPFGVRLLQCGVFHLLRQPGLISGERHCGARHCNGHHAWRDWVHCAL